MFKNVNIGPRLTIGFAIVLALLVGTTALAWMGLNAALRATESIVSVQQRLNMSQEWAAQTTLNVNRVMAQAMSRNDPRVVDHFTPLMAQSAKDVAALQKELETRIVSEQGKTLLASIGQKRDAYLAVRKRFFDALQMEDYGGAQDILNQELAPAAEAYSAEQQKMIAGQRNLMEQTAAESRTAVTRQITLRGSCSSAGEYPEAIERIQDGSIKVEPLLSKVAPLSEGADWFHKAVQPGNGLLKVVLKP